MKRVVRPDYVSPMPLVVKRDEDDDDDDQPTSSLPVPLASPLATSDSPKPQKPGDPKATSTASLQTNLASSTPTNSAVVTSGSGGLSTGASIGIGVAACSFVVLLLTVGFFLIRRRRAWKRFSEAKDPYDDEGASKKERPEVWAHAISPGAMEMVGEKSVHELPSPVVPVEAVGDHSHPAELPGCEVTPSNAEKGGNERLFDDSPIEPDNRSEMEARLINRKEIGS